MHALARNKRQFFFANYSAKTAVMDADGNRTGEYTIGYDNVVECKANISPARGSAELEQFGITENYDKTLVFTELLPISEKSIIWVYDQVVNSFSPTSSYLVGERALYQGKIYKARETLTPSAWNASKWAEEPNNYVVKAVGRSLNSTTLAIKEVTPRL